MAPDRLQDLDLALIRYQCLVGKDTLAQAWQRHKSSRGTRPRTSGVRSCPYLFFPPLAPSSQPREVFRRLCLGIEFPLRIANQCQIAIPSFGDGYTEEKPPDRESRPCGTHKAATRICQNRRTLRLGPGLLGAGSCVMFVKAYHMEPQTYPLLVPEL